MAVSVTYIGSNSDTTNLTSYGFTSEPIGSASADRIVVVGIVGRNTTAGTSISSVTIGGSSATIQVQTSNSDANYNIIGIATLGVPSGTTATINITFASQQLRCGIVVYTITGADTTPYATASDNAGTDPSLDVNVPAGGSCLAIGTSADNTTCSWTGLTEDADFTIETFTAFSSASDNFASAQTPLTITANFASEVGCCGCSISYQQSAGGGNISPYTSHYMRMSH